MTNKTNHAATIRTAAMTFIAAPSVEHLNKLNDAWRANARKVTEETLNEIIAELAPTRDAVTTRTDCVETFPDRFICGVGTHVLVRVPAGFENDRRFYASSIYALD